MKILIAIHQFFPRFYTGTETLALEIADELKRRNYEVSFITVEPDLPGDVTCTELNVIKDTYEGYNVWRIYIPPQHSHDPISRIERESNDKLLTQIFNDVLDEYNPDIVHAFHLMRLTFSFVEQVKKRKIPLYLTMTDFWLMCPTYQLKRYDSSLCSGQVPKHCFACLTSLYSKGMDRIPLKMSLAIRFPGLAGLFNNSAKEIQNLLGHRIVYNKSIIESADGVIWGNQFMKNLFENNGMFNNNDHIIPFPIPKRAQGLKELPLINNDQKLKVAFIGTMMHSKGPHVLMEACEIIENKYIKEEGKLEVFFWGAFNDTKKYELEMKQKSQNIDWVHFCGIFPQEKFADVLRDIDVVVIPSLWYENTPLTALSALSAKRILIVSDFGGLTSLIEDKVTGYKFPPGDSNALADILCDLVENKERILEISKAIPEPNNVEHYVDELTNIYN